MVDSELKINKGFLSMDYRQLYYQSHSTLHDLSTSEGINASARNEAYGCIFGRDSAITILKIVRAFLRAPNEEKEKFRPLLESSKKTLLTLVVLQGKEVNIESGEQPGKFIHEFRTSNFEHLTKGPRPWFVYPDGFLRNYDSIDSTPLNLIAIYRYWQATSDNEFLMSVLPGVEAGLNWILTYGDIDKDGLIEYEFPKERTYGGLYIQSWTDSHESYADINGLLPQYPIAPVEVQGYVWLCLKLWIDFYRNQSPSFAQKLDSYAKILKQRFNELFIFQDDDIYYAAQALDGDKNQIKTITANPVLCLWAAYKNGNHTESIVDEMFIGHFFKRIFMEDMYVENAGIRTMSTKSPTFNPYPWSYHNGSIWPMLNGQIYEALQNFNLNQQAEKLKNDSLIPIIHFGSAIELYNWNGDTYCEYLSPHGQKGCRQQAWSAAAILDMTVT